MRLPGELRDEGVAPRADVARGSWFWLLLAARGVAAYAACVLCVGPMVGVEVGPLPLAVTYLLALPWCWRDAVGVVREPLFWAMLLWAAWITLSLAWTPDVRKGVWELGTSRFGWVALALYPELRRRRGLIVALMVGFALTNLSQVALGVIRAAGWEHLDFNRRYPDRNPGWWIHPAVCGYMFVAALGLHLPVALRDGGWRAWACRAGLVGTWAGILATGTRGAMLAGLALCALAGCVEFVRRWRGSGSAGRVRLALWTASVVLVVGGVLAIIAGSESPGRRIREGVVEVRRVIEERDVSTFTGARVQFALWAWELWREHPVRGVGAGGYEHAVRAMLKARGENAQTPHIAPQAHNAVLHVGATLGVVGVGVMGFIAWSALRGAARRARGGVPIDASPLWALLGVLLILPFDVPHVNSPPAAMLAVLFVLTLRGPGRDVSG